MRSNRVISSTARCSSLPLMRRNTRSMIGAVYQDPNSIPIRPLGGSARQ
jgi:hypothetical protein